MKAYYYKIHYAYRLNELDYESRTFESKRFFFRQNCEDELALVLPRYIRLFKKGVPYSEIFEEETPKEMTNEDFLKYFCDVKFTNI